MFVGQTLGQFKCSSLMPHLLNLMLVIVIWENLPRTAVAAEETPAQAFAAEQATAKAASEKLDSAIGAGEFTVLLQNPDDAEPQPWSKAKVHVYFDRGKYHIQLSYEKRLTRVTTTQDGKTTTRIADGKYDDVRIIVDDDAVYVVNFSERIRPTGCSGEVFSREQQQMGFATAGFTWSDPARFWKQLPDIDQIIMNVGADAIAFSDLGEGRFRATYPIAKTYKAELDVGRSAEVRQTTWRVFNPERKSPTQGTTSKATWKKVNELWYVNEFVLENDTRGLGTKSENFSRSSFKYDSFEPNVKIESELFTLKSVAIPVRTRFIDRRPNPTAQFRYWNGTALQAERL